MAEKKFLISIGKKIKQHRLRNNMTQNDLAIECNFEKATMSRIESGKSNSTVRTLVKISNALGIHISELFID
jgi:transcriptional regulator with XRE-family HTH domain